MPPSFTDEGLRAVLGLREPAPELPVLLFSQYVETRYASRLLAGDARGVGYLLKDRVADVRDFVDASGGWPAARTVLDPEVVSQLMGSARQDDDLERLSAREREVLGLMAQGRSNGAIAELLHLSYGAVEKNVAAIFTKLDLPAGRRRPPPRPGGAPAPRGMTTMGVYPRRGRAIWGWPRGFTRYRARAGSAIVFS